MSFADSGIYYLLLFRQPQNKENCIQFFHFHQTKKKHLHILSAEQNNFIAQNQIQIYVMLHKLFPVKITKNYRRKQELAFLKYESRTGRIAQACIFDLFGSEQINTTIYLILRNLFQYSKKQEAKTRPPS